MKNYLFILIIFISQWAFGQCPEIANTTANGCLQLIWNTPPSPLPTIIGYTHSGGMGTSASPAVYQPGGGCGANKGGFTGSFTLNDGTICTYNGGALPVEISDFATVWDDGKVLLYFKTLSEINNDFFIVEKSLNGIDFYELTTLDGAGTSSEVQNYKYIDEKIEQTQQYYRIKQIDYDGKYSYSDIRMIKIPRLAKPYVFTNVTSSTLNLSTSLENYSIDVYNMAGQSVYSKSNLYGIQNIEIDKLQRGVYFIRLSTFSDFVIVKWMY